MNIKIIPASPRVSLQEYLDGKPTLELVIEENGNAGESVRWCANIRDTQNLDRVGSYGHGADQVLAVVEMCNNSRVPGFSLYYDAERGLK